MGTRLQCCLWLSPAAVFSLAQKTTFLKRRSCPLASANLKKEVEIQRQMSYLMSINSTSNIKAALGGIRPPAPLSP